MLDQILFSPIEPHKTGFLEVGQGHKIYWEECGNPNGKPILFFHGGPGYCSTPNHRRFFDPEKYRIILFDQRGAGKSKPYASIDNNTTDHLVEDIETLRKFFGIKQFILFGGSWGSTLAICYGIKYPNNVAGFILRGIFLGTAHESHWFFNSMAQFNPEAGIDYMEHLPAEEREKFLYHYYQRLQSQDSTTKLNAALSWHNYENRCVSLLPLDKIDKSSPDYLAPALIEAHYFIHDFFLKERPILENLKDIENIPTIIVQGRYDIVCPPITAYKLHKKMHQSRLQFVDIAGHSAFDIGIAKALVEATNEFLK